MNASNFPWLFLGVSVVVLASYAVLWPYRLVCLITSGVFENITEQPKTSFLKISNRRLREILYVTNEILTKTITDFRITARSEHSQEGV